VLNRDASAKLTISSPLEAHKSHTLCYSIVGIDVGFENPLFAALELDYSECDTDSTGAAIQKAQKVFINHISNS
jgi:splicing factor 3B subunit 3